VIFAFILCLSPLLSSFLFCCLATLFIFQKNCWKLFLQFFVYLFTYRFILWINLFLYFISQSHLILLFFPLFFVQLKYNSIDLSKCDDCFYVYFRIKESDSEIITVWLIRLVEKSPWVQLVRKWILPSLHRLRWIRFFSFFFLFFLFYLYIYINILLFSLFFYFKFFIIFV
jgi:hypothetical protein